MEAPPPPPPPHGANASGGRSGGLPDGKYDIFVIPPSSAGSGFLYLPSLHTQRNSFIAGVACTCLVFLIWNVTVPVVREWFYTTMNGGGGSGIIILLLAVGVMAWAFGKTQAEAGQGPNAAHGVPPGGASGTFHNAGTSKQAGAGFGPGANAGAQSPPRSSWQRPQPQANTGAKSSWEKAREETRKKEEEKRKAEELKKKKEELDKERQKQREKDVKERLERERKEAAERAAREAAGAKSSPKRPPMPTARTEDDEDAYSFRPYDRPKPKANSGASLYSESSYAPSQTTARTTPPPPPQSRGPYATRDPDKIIIKGVYSFSNAFMRTPISQLVSGQGSVTDGLILRITTEGLFIDDDRRGVPQREWDVKAWTMKLAEVWCPHLPYEVKKDSRRKSFNPFSAAASRQSVSPSEAESIAFVTSVLGFCNSRCPKTRAGPASTRSTSYSTVYTLDSDAGTDDPFQQSCEMAGLHILRASIRDPEGKKYVFIISQSEGWKVAVGLQRLRRGSQVRALGVAGMPMNEAKALLENLGYV